RSKVREIVVVVSGHEVVALDQLVDQVRASVPAQVQLNLVGADRGRGAAHVPGRAVHNRTIVAGAEQRGTSKRVTVVEDGEVSGAGNRPRELGGQLGVQAVNVLPGELLRHRDDDGELDRREADLASELVPADRLGRTLTVLQAGTGANLTGLREGVRQRHNGLVDTDRDLPGQTHKRRLLAGLAEDVADDRTGKTVRRQVVKTTLKRVVDHVGTATVRGTGSVSVSNLVNGSHLLSIPSLKVRHESSPHLGKLSFRGVRNGSGMTAPRLSRVHKTLRLRRLIQVEFLNKRLSVSLQFVLV